MISLLIFATYALLALLVTAVTLFLTGKWLRFKHRSALRATAVAGLWLLVGGAAMLIRASLPPSALTGLFMSLGMLLGIALAEIALLYFISRPTLAKTFAGWGISLAARTAVVGVGLLIIRPYVTEAYIAPPRAWRLRFSRHRRVKSAPSVVAR